MTKRYSISYSIEYPDGSSTASETVKRLYSMTLLRERIKDILGAMRVHGVFERMSVANYFIRSKKTHARIVYHCRNGMKLWVFINRADCPTRVTRSFKVDVHPDSQTVKVVNELESILVR